MQYAPGGPVEQVIAKIQNAGGGQRERREPVGLDLPRLAGARPRLPQGDREAVRLRQAAGRSVSSSSSMDYGRFDFGRSFFSKHSGDRPRRAEAAGVDLARHLDDLDLVSRFDPARHPQGGRRRLDGSTSARRCVVSVGFAIPSFLWGVLLVILFCGSFRPSYPEWLATWWPRFPLRGLTSENFSRNCR